MEGLTCLLLYWGNQPSWHERGQPLPSLLWAAICLFRSLPPYHDCGFVTISRSLTPSSVMVLCPLISFPQPSNMKKYHQFWQVSHLRAYKTISLNLHSLFISAAFTWWTLTFSPSPWTTQHAPQRFLWALPLLLAPWFNSPDPTSSSPFSGLLQTCLSLLLLSRFSLTLCDPTDGSPPGSAVPGILQARTLEWVAISFSNAWKWKVNVKLLSHVRLLVTP